MAGRLEVPCAGCGAGLRLNPKLAGTSVSCPSCGARVEVPRPPPPVPFEFGEEPAHPAKRLKLPMRFTLWLLGAQTVVAVLGLSCLAGAFWRGWKPPEHTYFREGAVVLAVAGVLLLLAGWLAHYLPVLTTLLVSVLVLGACGWHYHLAGRVDASRMLALAAAMLALWLALQHRRANAR